MSSCSCKLAKIYWYIDLLWPKTHQLLASGSWLRYRKMHWRFMTELNPDSELTTSSEQKRQDSHLGDGSSLAEAFQLLVYSARFVVMGLLEAARGIRRNRKHKPRLTEPNDHSKIPHRDRTPLNCIFNCSSLLVFAETVLCLNC